MEQQRQSPRENIYSPEPRASADRTVQDQTADTIRFSRTSTPISTDSGQGSPGLVGTTRGGRSQASPSPVQDQDRSLAAFSLVTSSGGSEVVLATPLPRVPPRVTFAPIALPPGRFENGMFRLNFPIVTPPPSVSQVIRRPPTPFPRNRGGEQQRELPEPRRLYRISEESVGDVSNASQDERDNEEWPPLPSRRD